MLFLILCRKNSHKHTMSNKHVVIFSMSHVHIPGVAIFDSMFNSGWPYSMVSTFIICGIYSYLYIINVLQIYTLICGFRSSDIFYWCRCPHGPFLFASQSTVGVCVVVHDWPVAKPSALKKNPLKPETISFSGDGSTTSELNTINDTNRPVQNQHEKDARKNNTILIFLE